MRGFDFNYYCQKIIPLVFDESLTYYEVLCAVTSKLNEELDALKALSTEVLNNEHLIKNIQEEIKSINTILEEIKSGKYTDIYIHTIEQWITQNIGIIAKEQIKQFVPYLNDNGYFCVDTIGAWTDIQFDTNINPNDKNYGCLQMTYSV